MLRCGYRKGDNAPMAIIEFVDRYVSGICLCSISSRSFYSGILWHTLRREGELRPARPAPGSDEYGVQAEAARDEVNDR